jgi:hypothetical protein
MPKSATDVMNEVILAAVTDAIEALKTASKGIPNSLLRDINAIHPNVAYADLPAELRTAITQSVRNAFNRLLKEGYNVSEGRAAPARPAAPRPPQGGRPGGDQRRNTRPGARPARPGAPRGPGKAGPGKSGPTKPGPGKR